MLTPATTTELQQCIIDATRTNTPLRIVGAGTWMNAGHTVRASTQVCTLALSGVVEYVPGDLVITARAGTSLRELAGVTAEHGQWLPLDPAGTDDGTIGATIATASQGPLALGFGGARDLILGLTCVTGTGDVVRAGGRVVKNVAGFDLVRLLTGSWGTLGVITEVSLRLHARTTVDTTVAISIGPTHNLASLVERMNTQPLVAVTSSLAACVMLSTETARAVGVTHAEAGALTLLARMTGNPSRVQALQHALSSLGSCASVDTGAWETLRGLDSGNTSLVFTGPPAASADTLKYALDWCSAVEATTTYVVMEPLRGAVRVWCDTPVAHPSVAFPSSVQPLRLPDAWWSFGAQQSANHALECRLRDRFDPHRLLNPGILGVPLSEQSTT